MPLTFNGSTPENVNWNGVALSKVTYNGGVVWEKVSNTLLQSCYWSNRSTTPNATDSEWAPANYEESNNHDYYSCALKISSKSMNNRSTLNVRLKNTDSSSFSFTFRTYPQSVADDLKDMTLGKTYGSGYLENITVFIEAGYDDYYPLDLEPSKYAGYDYFILVIRSTSSSNNKKWGAYGKPGGEYQPYFE